MVTNDAAATNPTHHLTTCEAEKTDVPLLGDTPFENYKTTALYP
jgi:hypothetical protein